MTRKYPGFIPLLLFAFFVVGAGYLMAGVGFVQAVLSFEKPLPSLVVLAIVLSPFLYFWKVWRRNQ